MKMTGTIRRVDDLGRIVIPKEIRRLVFGKTDATGEPMEIFIDGENIVLRRYKEMQTCEWIKYDYRTICLYEYSVKVDKSKEVKYVEFTKGYGGAGIITVLGISRKGTGGVATGIENIENRPAVNAAEGIYTINGVKINSLQKGINIIKMADGTTRKVVIK